MFLEIIFLISFICSGEPLITAVVKFETKADHHLLDAKAFTAGVRNALLKDSRFFVLEENIVDEMVAQANAKDILYCNNEQCLLSLGKILSIRCMVGGELFYGRNNDLNITMFLVDAENGSVISILKKKMKNIEGSENRNALECTKELITKLNYNSSNNSTKKKKPLLQRFSFWAPFSGTVAVITVGALYLLNNSSEKQNDTKELNLDDAPVRTR